MLVSIDTSTEKLLPLGRGSSPEDDLDIICNALDAYVIEYLLDEDMKKYITQASSTRDKINKLIPDNWNWAGE